MIKLFEKARLFMSRYYNKNFFWFVLCLLGCTGFLCFLLIRAEQSIDHTTDWIDHTNTVISASENFGAQVEGMIGDQRGFILSQNDDFLDRYYKNRDGARSTLERLSELTTNNADQQKRADIMTILLSDIITGLDDRAKTLRFFNSAQVIESIQHMQEKKVRLLALNTDFLAQERELLRLRIAKLEAKKQEYFYALMFGIIASTLILIALNWFLLQSQRKRARALESLNDVEERLTLAVEGTQDGIYDWNVKTGEVYYSPRFFTMLGYYDRPTLGQFQDFVDLLHPDDVVVMREKVDLYLSGQTSEYVAEFRMKHKSGRWVWIQSKAKALFDKQGKAYRLVGAHTDITALIHIQERLLHEKTMAEKANSAKSDFLAHMSHEIRTPLTAISGVAEILDRSKTNLDKKQQKLVSVLSSSSGALKDIVNDILDFSKIESGELDLMNEEFDLDDLFEEVVNMINIKTSEKSLQFNCTYDGIKNIVFYGDKVRLRQIVTNLLGNAVKFTDKGYVSLDCDLHTMNDQEYLRIAITDTGLGIAPEDIDVIFERFKQGDASISRRYGGTGLGLPISKSLVELMGGKISVTSTLGQGSMFTVLLPRVVKTKENVQNNASSITEKLSNRIAALEPTSKKILMAEDYEGNIIVVGYALEEMGLAYDVARNGVEAIDMWKKNHYDLILMDVQMPEMDGFTATQRIRNIESLESLSRTPIIAMTAHALISNRQECIDAGMDYFLAKPIDELALKSALIKYLEPSENPIISA